MFVRPGKEHRVEAEAIMELCAFALAAAHGLDRFGTTVCPQAPCRIRTLAFA
jgi:hypothetical protein